MWRRVKIVKIYDEIVISKQAVYKQYKDKLHTVCTFACAYRARCSVSIRAD